MTKIFESVVLLLNLALSVQGFVAPSPRATGNGGVDVRAGTGCRRGVPTSRRPSLGRLEARSDPRSHDDEPIGVLLPRNSRAKKAQSVDTSAESMKRWNYRSEVTEGGSSSSSTTRERFLEAGSTAAAVFGATVLGAVGFPAGTAFGGRIAGVESAGAVQPLVAATALGDSPTLLETQILAYVREALPAWRPLPDSDIELKQITGGITNVIFKARNAGTGERALVRVYGKDTDLLLDRRKEAAVFSELSTLGFGPRKLGEFKEGRVEELLDARAATPAELLETRPFDVPRAIATQLATFHGQHVQSSAGSPARPVMWTTIDRWLETATRLDVSKAFPLDKVAAEVAWLKQRLPDAVGTRTPSPSPAQKLAAEISDGTVFAHNDLLSGNVLVGPRGAKQISTLRLIDFEYSDYNPCGYDIANHFCECAGFDADFRRKYPSVVQRRRFLEAYVEAAGASRRIPGITPDSDPSTNDLLRELVTRVDRYTLASHLTWGLWAIIQANTSEIEGFDFAGYAKKRLDGYTFHKGQFFAKADG